MMEEHFDQVRQLAEVGVKCGLIRLLQGQPSGRVVVLIGRVVADHICSRRRGQALATCLRKARNSLVRWRGRQSWMTLPEQLRRPARHPEPDRGLEQHLPQHLPLDVGVDPTRQPDRASFLQPRHPASAVGGSSLRHRRLRIADQLHDLQHRRPLGGGQYNQARCTSRTGAMHDCTRRSNSARSHSFDLQNHHMRSHNALSHTTHYHPEFGPRNTRRTRSDSPTA